MKTLRKGNATQLAANKSLEDDLLSTAFENNPFEKLKVNIDTNDYTVTSARRRPPPKHNIRLSLDFLNSIKAPITNH